MALDWENLLSVSYPGKRKLLLWLAACIRRFETRLELPDVYECLDSALALLDNKVIDRNEITKLRNKLFAHECSSNIWLTRNQRLHVMSLIRQLTLLVSQTRSSKQGMVNRSIRLRDDMARLMGELPPWPMRRQAINKEEEVQFQLYREVVPTNKQWEFIEPIFQPEWLTWNYSCIPEMAKAIYKGKRFDEVPIIADALEEAGCNDPEILGHCREQRIHFRGCWVIDCILGLEKTEVKDNTQEKRSVIWGGNYYEE